MASFPSNVDNGELWLPAGAFPEEMYRPNGRPAAKLEAELACELTSSMEELAQRLALAILDETYHHPPEPISLLSSFPQVNPQRSSQTYPAFGPPCFQITGYAHKPSQPSLPKPVPRTTQLLLKPSLNQLLSRTRNQSRGLPFRVVGSGASGFIRESGGTGVFLPRVVHADACMRRKPNAKPVEEQPLRNAGVGRVSGHVGGVNSISIQNFGRHRLSSEMALPSEWTY